MSEPSRKPSPEYLRAEALIAALDAEVAPDLVLKGIWKVWIIATANMMAEWRRQESEVMCG